MPADRPAYRPAALPDDEPDRLAALQSFAVLDTAPEPAFDDFTVLASRLLGMPIALVSLVDGARQWFKSRVGVAITETPRAHAFCAHAILSPALFEVPDALADARFAGNPLVTGATALRYYAGAPLVVDGGHAVGTLCVMDRRPRRLSGDERDTLQRLARQVVLVLELRRAAHARDAAFARLQRREAELERLALVAERTHNVVILSDTAGRITWTNAAFTRVTGYGADEARGRRARDLLQFERTRAQDREALERAITEQRAARVQILNRGKHGRVYWMDVDLQPLRDADGRVSGFVAIETDVTEIVRQRERADALLQALPVGVLVQDRDGTVRDANEELGRLTGAGVASLVGRRLDARALRPIDAAGRPLRPADSPLPQVLARGAPVAAGPIGIRRPDGTRRWLRVTSVPLRGADGAIEQVLSCLLDETDERLQRQLLTLAIDAARIAPWRWDLGCDRVQVQRQAMRAAGLRLFGDGHDMLEVAFWPAVHRDDVARVRESLAAHELDPQRPYRAEFRLRGEDGVWCWVQATGAATERDELGRIRHMAGVLLDVTDRRASEEALQRAATTDQLTGLPNRRVLRDRLQQALRSARRQRHFGALLFIDLDHFKRVNDVYGHGIGDRVLVDTGARLSALLRDEDTLARMGGDELMVLLPALADGPDGAGRGADQVAARLLQALARPFDVDGLSFTLGASIGCTVFPKSDTETADDLVREADTAMYAAKAAGRGTLRPYASQMQQAVALRFALERDLREAEARDEFSLHLQGKHRPDGSLAGAEVLLRWTHPTRGAVGPQEFIPVAEDSGLILGIGRWVLCRALALAAAQRRAGRPLALAVNVSPRQFREPGFADELLALAAEAGAQARDITLELTEGVLIDDVDASARRMTRLAAAGFRFSIDDFGTGYSSLMYLKRLPIHELKVDKAFVRDLEADPEDAAIVQAILSIGQRFGIAIVAEGVETAAQAAFLERQGCTLMQGWLFGRALPQAEFLAAHALVDGVAA